MHLTMHDILPNLRRSSPAARQTVSIRPVHHIPSHSRHRSPLPDGVLPPAHSLPAWQSEMLQCSNLLLLSRNVLCPVYSFSQKSLSLTTHQRKVLLYCRFSPAHLISSTFAPNSIHCSAKGRMSFSTSRISVISRPSARFCHS